MNKLFRNTFSLTGAYGESSVTRTGKVLDVCTDAGLPLLVNVQHLPNFIVGNSPLQGTKCELGNGIIQYMPFYHFLKISHFSTQRFTLV